MQILAALGENSINIRTRAVRSLTGVVEVDPDVLGYKHIQIGVRTSFLDQSSSVREAAVDLIGKYVLTSVTLIEQYLEMIMERILVSRWIHLHYYKHSY